MIRVLTLCLTIATMPTWATPATESPPPGTRSWLNELADAQLTSGQGSGQHGHSVTAVGDLNGDGFGDLAVGAFGFDGGATNSGAVFIYFGRAAGFDTVADGQLTLGIADARLGSSVAAAGDLNGDGYDDLIVGAVQYANGQANEGAAFVYFGGPGNQFNPVADGILENNQANAFMGGAVAGVGDVNGDGFADVAVGAAAWDNSANGNEGRVFIYFGGAGGTFDTTPDVQLFSSQLNAAFGSSLSGGDINGDGFSDLVVGSVLYDNGETDEGNAFVYHGGAAFNSVVDGELQSNQAGAQLGGSVSVVGDVNGDGYADVLVGARRYANGQSSEGAAFLFFGGAGPMNTTVDVILEGNQVDAELGHTVAAAGDVNGDGYADILIGAPLYDVAVGNSGAAFLYPGGRGAFDAVTDAFLSAASNGRMGFSVSGGDVNRDGYADVVVGAPSFDAGVVDEGAAFVYFGGGDGIEGIAAGQVTAAQGGAQSGHSVALGDVNGDGFADRVVGAFGFDRPGFTNSGAVFIYFGNNGSFNAVADAQLGINQVDARFGASVAVGDVNGDGFADVLVGAPEWDDGQTNEGGVFVYLGGPGPFNTVADLVLQSDQANAQLGSSVTVLGDVNGDGLNDFGAGAEFFDNGSSDEGIALVYFGGRILSGVSVGLLEVNQGSAFLGGSMAGAGDVNGDGFADVLVGGIGFDATGASNSGVVQVYFGGAGTAFNAVADASLTSTSGARLGSSVSSAGDFNGDGYADVIVGAFEYSSGQASEGAAFLYLGGPGAFNSVADAVFELNQAGARLGAAVAGAGDINGDGLGDVVIGAQDFDAGQTDEGAVFVHFGSVALDTVVDLQLEANQAASRFGFALAVGDSNADGFADVLIGAPSLDVGITDDGSAVLHFGNQQGRLVAAEQINFANGPLSPWGLSGSA